MSAVMLSDSAVPSVVTAFPLLVTDYTSPVSLFRILLAWNSESISHSLLAYSLMCLEQVKAYAEQHTSSLSSWRRLLLIFYSSRNSKIHVWGSVIGFFLTLCAGTNWSLWFCRLAWLLYLPGASVFSSDVSPISFWALLIFWAMCLFILADMMRNRSSHAVLRQVIAR